MKSFWKTTTLYVTALLVSMLGLIAAAYADPLDKFREDNQLDLPASQQSVVIGDQNYKQAQILWDFTNVAVSDHLWFDVTDDPSDSVIAFIDHQPTTRADKFTERRRNIPWLVDYFDRPKGMPRHAAVNKWTNEITIGLDWPKYGENHLSILSGNEEDRLHEYYPEIIQHIQSAAPALEQLTGLPVRFIAPTDPAEKTEDHAKIRIIIAAKSSMQNYFKFLRSPLKLDERLFERWILGGVRFTPYARSQVEGFFVPNEDNSIGLAVCYLMPDVVGSEMTKSLLSECLVRSLGLPSSSEVNTSALIGNWNAAFDDVSRTEALDGVDGSLIPGSITEWKNDFRKHASDQKAQPANLTEYDKLMISLLYCKSLKPGTDRYGALRSITRDAKCMENLKGETR